MSAQLESFASGQSRNTVVQQLRTDQPGSSFQQHFYNFSNNNTHHSGELIRQYTQPSLAQQTMNQMKSSDLLDYSKTQTNRSLVSSRYNFRQILSPVPKDYNFDKLPCNDFDNTQSNQRYDFYDPEEERKSGHLTASCVPTESLKSNQQSLTMIKLLQVDNSSSQESFHERVSLQKYQQIEAKYLQKDENIEEEVHSVEQSSDTQIIKYHNEPIYRETRFDPYRGEQETNSNCSTQINKLSETQQNFFQIEATKDFIQQIQNELEQQRKLINNQQKRIYNLHAYQSSAPVVSEDSLSTTNKENLVNPKCQVLTEQKPVCILPKSPNQTSVLTEVLQSQNTHQHYQSMGQTAHANNGSILIHQNSSVVKQTPLFAKTQQQMTGGEVSNLSSSGGGGVGLLQTSGTYDKQRQFSFSEQKRRGEDEQQETNVFAARNTDENLKECMQMVDEHFKEGHSKHNRISSFTQHVVEEYFEQQEKFNESQVPHSVTPAKKTRNPLVHRDMTAQANQSNSFQILLIGDKEDSEPQPLNYSQSFVHPQHPTQQERTSLSTVSFQQNSQLTHSQTHNRHPSRITLQTIQNMSCAETKTMLGSIHNESITEKIKSLREDIQNLFPAGTGSSIRNESASPRATLQTPAAMKLSNLNPSSATQESQKQILLPRQLSQPRNFDGGQPPRLTNLNAGALQSSQGAIFLTQSSSQQQQQVILKTPSKSETRGDRLNKVSYLQSSLNKLTERIQENKQQNQNIIQSAQQRKSNIQEVLNKTASVSQELKTYAQSWQAQQANLQTQEDEENDDMYQVSQYVQTSPLRGGEYHHEVDQQTDTQALNCEIQRLAECLTQEKDKLKEFKNRLLKKKEQEAKKYQEEIRFLKEEVFQIEERYTQEVKKLEDHYKKYRDSKNSKFSQKLKDQASKYEALLGQERAKNAQLEEEISELRQSLQLQQPNTPSDTKSCSLTHNDIKKIEKYFEKQKHSELEHFKKDYESKISEVKHKYEKLMSDVRTKTQQKLEKELTLLQDTSLRLQEENKRLKNQVTFFEWKDTNQVLTLNNQPQVKQQKIDQCLKCQNLLMTNSKLLGKLRRITSTSANNVSGGCNLKKSASKGKTSSLSKERWHLVGGSNEMGVVKQETKREEGPKMSSEVGHTGNRTKLSKGVLQFNSNALNEASSLRMLEGSLPTQLNLYRGGEVFSEGLTRKASEGVQSRRLVTGGSKERVSLMPTCKGGDRPISKSRLYLSADDSIVE